MLDLDEAVREFLVESRENLDQLDKDFVALEAEPGRHELISSIFRTVHTIKGTAGFLGFRKLEGLTHVGESVLSRIRDGELAFTVAITSELLTMVDRIRSMLTLVETVGNDGEQAHDDVIARLNAHLEGRADTATPALKPQAGAETVSAEAPKVPPSVKPHPEPSRSPEPSAPVSPPPPSPPPAPPPLASPPSAPPMPAAPPTLTSRPAPPATSAISTPPSASAPEAAAAWGASSPAADLNVRVDVSLLDKLMNLVGELVLARNQLVQVGARQEDQSFQGAVQRLSLITTELQENVMKTRMQPIGSIWSKVPRLVRDLAIQLGKQVRLEMVGQETELDRTVLEAIKDALTHVVRNSIDHGLELPAVRAAAGKPMTGTLALRAFHEGGQVNVEISDDGSGLDTDAIRRKAVDRGLISSDRATRMSDGEIAQLIFLPGFSTAERVSNISGRGVGMDVVKSNVERIGGTVELVSRLGQGTTIRIKIPLTLAIIPALVVQSNGERYAIPQVNLVELIHIDDDDQTGSIEWIEGSAFFRLRGALLVLVDLGTQLGGASRRAEPTVATGLADQVQRYRVAIAALGKHLIEGAALDAEAIRAARQWTDHPSQAAGAADALHQTCRTLLGEVETAIVAGRDAEAYRGMAQLADLVRRLEALPNTARTGGAVPSASKSSVTSKTTDSRSRGTNVVVLQADGRTFGLIVDEVLDTEEIVVKPLGKELKGIPVYAGATIMGDGRVALILDVVGLAHHAAAVSMESNEGWGASEEASTGDAAHERNEIQTLLLFSVGTDETMAIPLSAVARIEEFPFERLERVGRRPVVQYRGTILQLIELGPVLTQMAHSTGPRRPVQVIVHARGDRQVGLIVHSILDVVTDAVALAGASEQVGLSGARVVQGRVVELLEPDDLIRTHAPTLLPRSAV